jgi:hypothetical protein
MIYSCLAAPVRFLLPIFALIIPLSRAEAASDSTEPISASAVLDPKESPQGEFLIGVHFKIQAGWHLYWRHAGDVGLPTQVRFTLPKGASAGELQWPIPVRFTQAGGLVGIGYEDEVVLFSKLKVPGDSANNEISLQARWVACSSKICVPGKKEFHFKVADLMSRSGLELMEFAKWAEEVPVGLDQTKADVLSHCSFDSSNPKLSRHEVVFDWKIPATPIDWFPQLDRTIKMTGFKIETLGSKTTVSFNLERFEQSPWSDLEAVVVIDSAGRRLGFTHPLNCK